MTKKEQREMIRTYYSRMLRCLMSSSYEHRYRRMQEASEKEHRNMPFGARHWGITKPTAVELFYVRDVLVYLGNGPDSRHIPDAKDFFWLKEPVYAGYALFRENEKAIRAAFTTDDANAFLAGVDYAELVA